MKTAITILSIGVALLLIILSVGVPASILWGVWLLILGNSWHIALIPPTIALSVTLIAGALAGIIILIKGMAD